MDVYQLVVIGSATMTSAIITNGAAVGSGIFLLPMLALVFPPKIALGLGAPIMFAGNIMGIRNYWREWTDWRELTRTLVAATIGIFLGAYVIDMIPSRTFKLGIGIFSVSFSLYELIKSLGLFRRFSSGTKDSLDQAGRFSGKVGCVVIGLLGGVATVLAHAGGMIWSMYYVGKNLEKRCFVSTIIILLTLSNLVKILTYMKIGILDMETNLIVMAMFPVIILGGNLGNFLNKRVEPILFRRIVLLLILGSGVGLIAAY